MLGALGKILWTLAAYFATGLAALVYEIAYTDALFLGFGSSLFAYTTILCVFLAGFGIGSIAISRLRLKLSSAEAFVWMQFIIAAWALLFIIMLNSSSLLQFMLFTSVRDHYLIFVMLRFAFIFAFLLVPAAMMGASFPVVASLIAHRENFASDISRIFAINTAGAITGSLLAGFVLIPAIGLENTLAFAAGISVTAAIIIAWTWRASISNRWIAGLGLAVAVTVIFAMLHIRIDPYTIGAYYTANQVTGLEEYRAKMAGERQLTSILYSKFGLYGSVIVKEFADSKVLLLNGKPDASSFGDIPTQYLLGYIPMLNHPKPERVAVVGLGAGFTLSAVNTFAGVDKIDVFEINPDVVEAQALFARESDYALQDPRVTVRVGDARNLLRQSPEKYDVLISEPSNPWLEGESYLFTQEYYRTVASSLNDDGLFMQWVGAYDFNSEDFDILLSTVHSVFPYYQVWSEHTGGDMFILAGKQKIQADYYRVGQQISQPLQSQDFGLIQQITSRDPLTGADLFFSFYLGDQDSLGSIAASQVNTDNLPVIEFRTARNRVVGQKTVPLLNVVSKSGYPRAFVYPAVYNMTGSNGELWHAKAVLRQPANFSVPGPQYFFYYDELSAANARNQVTFNLQAKRYVILKDDSGNLEVHGHPVKGQPTTEEYKVIADALRSELYQVSEGYWGLRSNTTEGLAFYCPAQKTVIIAYYSGQILNSEKRKGVQQVAAGIQCLAP